MRYGFSYGKSSKMARLIKEQAIANFESNEEKKKIQEDDSKLVSMMNLYYLTSGLGFALLFTLIVYLFLTNKPNDFMTLTSPVLTTLVYLFFI